MRCFIVSFLFMLGFCGGFTRVAAADDPLPVYVSILPQRDFVQQIAKDRVAVEVMVLPGANPATYEPKAQQMAGLARARIYFAVGAPFEAVWLPRIAAANPSMRIVHTDDGIAKRTMAAHYHGRRVEAGAEHDHGTYDPHVWLSPPLVKIQARAILEALVAVDPDHQAFYEANWRHFVRRLDALDQHLQETFARRRGMRFMVFHPAWGYFADAYGLTQVPIELEGKAPKPAQLQALMEIARRHGISVIFVQPQFSRRSAELVAREVDARVVTADPLPADWFANMNEVAAKFEAALK
jgi:zinc transport system substrate-binding protein